MEYRQLGNSELRVSEIALGSWLTFSGGVGKDTTEACVKAAFDAGITFFDTANIYGSGAAEEAWGEILTAYPRESYILGTKVALPMSDDHPGGLSAKEIHQQLDNSLSRLRTDYVDLYQCHCYDLNTPLEETMQALTDVVRAGKVRYLGFSEWLPEQVSAALAMPEVERFVSSQPQYSALCRLPENQIFPLCQDNGISQIVWSPLAQGVLTGKYRPGEAPPADSRAAHSEMGEFIGMWTAEATLQAVEKLRPIAESADLTMPQLALAWVLQRKEVAAAIVGASRPDQVHGNAAASGVRLGQDVVDAVNSTLADVAVTGYRQSDK